MVKINKIIHDSIVDGPGVRSVIFTQGCLHNCEGCHNYDTMSQDGGYMMSIEDIVKEIKAFNFTNKVTISGGDPMIQENIIELVKVLKEHNYNVMLYTGYTIEEIKEGEKSEILNYLDILVDGKFDISKRDISLKYRGSSNQIIHMLR